MRFSTSLLKTNKEAKQFDSINATLLQKAGFVDQTMAGVYTFLPLGWRVLDKIEDIVRAEMDKVGAEMLMPAIVPEELWQTTKRFEKVDVLMKACAANPLSAKKNDASYVLNSTHEEVITPIAKKIKPSYKDLPFAVYQIQTKFRNEERPKSGLLRGREFRMKDLYSFHATEEDLMSFYEQIKEIYTAIFERLGISDKTIIAKAAGGDFTKGFSHEFDTKCETGEDVVYQDKSSGEYYNKEVASEELIESGEGIQVCEVGNIFPLGTKFAEDFDYYYTDKDGQRKSIYMASYGIGTSRVMGVLVELFHDEAGIIWSANVAPAQVHLVSIDNGRGEVTKKARRLYEQLQAEGVEVLFDDREEVSGGEKLTDADLIGIPWRVVMSDKTADKVEVKRRGEKKEKLIETDKLIEVISDNESNG